MKDILSQAAQDVPADSSPAPETPAAATDIPDAGPGDAPEGSGKKGRTLDEVRGELNRKLEQANAATKAANERLARIEGMLEAQRSAQPGIAAPAAAPDVNSMTADQLEALRPSITAEQKPAFDRLVATRREDERLRGQVTAEFARRDLERTRKEANQAAFERYPDMHNNSSPLYVAVNKVLNEWGDGLVRGNPRAVLDAANEAATRLGIAPKSRLAPHVPTPVGGRTAPAPSGGSGASTLSDADAREIADALKGALPRGKTFNLDRVKAGHAEYVKHQNLIVKQ